MTVDSRTTHASASPAGQSLLPFAEAALLRQRVLPAQFARIAGVSKTTVSRWVADGTIALHGDGRIDPVAALRRLIDRSSPGRLRVRWLRQATADLTELRAEAAEAGRLRDALTAERRVAAESHAEMAAWIEGFERRIAGLPLDARATADPAGWAALVHAILVESADCSLDGACEASEGGGAHEP